MEARHSSCRGESPEHILVSSPYIAGLLIVFEQILCSCRNSPAVYSQIVLQPTITMQCETKCCRLWLRRQISAFPAAQFLRARSRESPASSPGKSASCGVCPGCLPASRWPGTDGADTRANNAGIPCNRTLHLEAADRRHTPHCKCVPAPGSYTGGRCERSALAARSPSCRSRSERSRQVVPVCRRPSDNAADPREGKPSPPSPLRKSHRGVRRQQVRL